ncbi:MAG: ATP-binding cassette domain-containing protein [Actinomycetaceae bacterium]|nr:ATP-binding cassette domain-containing protein [Actinomycetaceae bacterium]
MKLRGIPTWFFVPAAIALLFLVIPLVGMGLRVPWTRLPDILSTDAALDALFLSLRTCAVTVLVCVTIGTPLALILARGAERPRPPWWLTPVRAFILVPLVMPPVVAGIALLTTFGRKGLMGASLGFLGVQIPFTTLAVVLSQTFIALPYLIVTVETAAKAAGSNLEHAAASLGAGRWTQFSRITLPLLGPSVASGAALAFARSLGEFGATITFAGSLQGVTRTLPLEVYLQREVDSPTALALSVVLILLAIVLTATTTLIDGRILRRFSTADGRTDLDTDDNLHDVSAGDSIAPVPTSGWTLHAEVPERSVCFDLESKAGGTLAIIGPNGSGKSTAVRLLAGDITSRESKVSVPRPVGFLDQNPALFPHMTLLENVAFGPRCHGMNKAEAQARALAELTFVGLDALAARAPWQLSGGQAQRVALARMLAVDPQLLLLDEPFAALDRASAAALRTRIAQRTKAGLTCVLVTHDVLDVLVLASEVAVLESGSLVTSGPVSQVLAVPPNSFVAHFSGLNILSGIFAEDGVQVSADVRITGQVEGRIDEGTAAVAVFTPASVALRTQLTPGSPRNVWSAQIVGIQASTSGIDVRLSLSEAPGENLAITATVTTDAVTALGLEVGENVYAEVKAMQVKVYPSPEMLPNL